MILGWSLNKAVLGESPRAVLYKENKKKMKEREVMKGGKDFELLLVSVTNSQDSPCTALANLTVPAELLFSEDKVEACSMSGFFSHSLFVWL